MGQAWLELVTTPATMRVKSPAGATLQRGARLPLRTALYVSGELELLVDEQEPGHFAARLAVLPFEGGWLLSCQGEVPDDAPRLNGVVPQGRVPLADRDLIHDARGATFRFWSDEPSSVDHLVMARLRSHPVDRSELKVFVDHLLDRDAPLGHYVSSALAGTVDLTEQRRWLGGLAPLEVDGLASFEWRDGLIRSAALRDLLPIGSAPLFAISELLELEVSAQLESLWLDAGGYQANAAAFLSVLQHHGGHPLLKRISFGAVSLSESWAIEQEPHSSEQLRRLFPRLERAPLFEPFRHAQLVTITSPRRAAGSVMPLGAETLQVQTHPVGTLTTVESWTIRASVNRSRFQVHFRAPTECKINGRLQHRSPVVLRDRDQVELGEDLFHFELLP